MPRWFPRTRGDGPPERGGTIRAQGVPPHPRGWSLARGQPSGERPGSPAPAGMVPIPASTWADSGRFPRTRGDGPHPA